ncbi:MAG: anthranilate synthase component I family protein [Phycisphaerales bacterium]|nr:anthranilate synthase component I family protein [Phycisphaerales bacterium]
MAWMLREVVYPANLLSAADRLAAGGELCVFDCAGDSESAVEPAFSMICHEPRGVFEQPRGGSARFSAAGQVSREAANGWALFRELIDSVRRMPKAPFPLAPGWVGYFGYEMNGLLERLPAPREPIIDMPQARLAFFDAAIVLDHRQHRAFALHVPAAATWIAKAPPTDIDEFCERWTMAVATSQALPKLELATRDMLKAIRVQIPVTQREYEQRVDRVRNYIASGDIYQANISHPILVQGITNSVALAESVREKNPAGFSGYLRWGSRAVISASPELFISLVEGMLKTRPIKGTARRSRDPLLDALARKSLLDSEKDRAELAMIVDLHRNDIGRVCELGSVRVDRARVLETHPRVYHTVAEISGRIAAGQTAMEALQASFPPGSVTGAPKIRAMQIIHEIEPMARGVYCGSLCAFPLDGSLIANVAIRTMQLSGSNGVMHVGGGVVADSDPASEYDETLAKAQSFLSSLETGTALVNHAARPLHYD